MNLSHLKYVLEVDKTRSISKAAANLFMGQPNLSRAIKDLEDTLGIVIFKRTSKGIEPTAQGEEFLNYARKIMSDVEQVEAKYINENPDKQVFSISLPRASYVAYAFNNFINRIDKTKSIDFNYKETNAMRVIKNVEQDGFNLGILRYQAKFEDYFLGILKEKGLLSKEIFSFSYLILTSKDSELYKKERISLKDLRNYIEILHGDPYVPSLSVTEAKKAEFSGITDKNIYIYERGSQFEMLDNVKEAYMWISPIPENMLLKFNLAQRKCVEYDKTYIDVLIYKKNYNFSDIDKIFLEELRKSIKELDKISLK